jgi:hypothetical protein
VAEHSKTEATTAQAALDLIENHGLEIAVELALLMDIGYYLCVETYYMEADGPRFQYVYDRISILYDRVGNDDTLVNDRTMIAAFKVDDDQDLQLWVQQKRQSVIEPVRTYFFKLWESGGMQGLA